MQRRPSLCLPAEIRGAQGADEDTVARKKIPGRRAGGPRGRACDRECAEPQASALLRRNLAVTDRLVGEGRGKHVEGMDSVVGTECTKRRSGWRERSHCLMWFAWPWVSITFSIVRPGCGPGPGRGGGGAAGRSPRPSPRLPPRNSNIRARAGSPGRLPDQ